jgi:hypothetical protein
MKLSTILRSSSLSSLSYRLPTKERKDGAELRGRLQRLGVFSQSGHEHFNGCVVVPITDSTGAVVEIYGRKLDWDPRTGQPAHLYLPGAHRGVWNSEGLSAGEVIICESLIDALSFWCAGYRNVTATYGTAGFTDDPGPRSAATKCAGCSSPTTMTTPATAPPKSRPSSSWPPVPSACGCCSPGGRTPTTSLSAPTTRLVSLAVTCPRPADWEGRRQDGCRQQCQMSSKRFSRRFLGGRTTRSLLGGKTGWPVEARALLPRRSRHLLANRTGAPHGA